MCITACVCIFGWEIKEEYFTNAVRQQLLMLQCLTVMANMHINILQIQIQLATKPNRHSLVS